MATVTGYPGSFLKMRLMGSKSRIAEEIVPIIQGDIYKYGINNLHRDALRRMQCCRQGKM